MKNKRAILICCMVLLTLNQLAAQAIITDDPSISNRVYLRAGIEPATMLTVGYERQLNVAFLNRDLVAFAELGTSIAKFNNKELKIGGILPVYEIGKFKIINNLNLSAGSLSAKNFDSKKFAIADEVAFGIYGQKLFVALTAEYENIFLNKIQHTDFYRDTYYANAVDGWYKGAGGLFQFGIEGGITINRMIDIYAELKLPATEKFNSFGGSPMHVNIGVGYRF